MSFITFENVNKAFGKTPVLKNINLEIEQGSFVTLLGPSGCGKSTLLRCLAGLEQVSSGRIRMDGEDITSKAPQKRNIGMVFQQYSLFPNLNVFDNIAFGLKIMKISEELIKSRVATLLEHLELTGKEHAFPSKLSGGQQQRVALARSMVMQPKVLLLDEPLSAIDAKLRKSLRKHIIDLHKAYGITCIFVTHDQDEALIMSDIIHLFHDGVIEQSGTPIDMYTRPNTHFAASFIGNYNILPPGDFAQMVNEKASTSDIAIRPEAIELMPLRPEPHEDVFILPATVKDFIPHGNVLRYSIETNGIKLHADVLFRSFQLFQEGQQVYIKLEKRNCLHVEN